MKTYKMLDTQANYDPFVSNIARCKLMNIIT